VIAKAALYTDLAATQMIQCQCAGKMLRIFEIITFNVRTYDEVVVLRATLYSTSATSK